MYDTGISHKPISPLPPQSTWAGSTPFTRLHIPVCIVFIYTSLSVSIHVEACVHYVCVSHM